MAITRGYLKGFGLEAEQIDDIMAKYGVALQSKDQEIGTLTDQVDSYRSDADSLKDEIAQLKEKSEGNEDLQNQIQSLQDKLQKAEEDKKAIVVESEIKIATANKLHNPDDAMKFIDPEKIELDDNGKPTNMDELLKQLSEDRPYLFVTDNSANQQTDAAKGEGSEEQQQQTQTEQEVNTDPVAAAKALAASMYNPGTAQGNNGQKVTPAETGKAMAQNLFGKKEE